jgi:ADP-ribose pyrophosphatase
LSEKVITSERIYDGKVIRVRKDTVRLQNGAIGQRDIVEHHGAVAIVPMIDAETVLLVSQYRAAACKTLLEIPAGSMNKDEDSQTCAYRELIEETQYQAGKLARLFAMFSAPGFCTEKLTVFLATELSPKAGKPDEDEFIDVRKVKLADAVRMIDTGEIEDAKSIAGLLAVARRLSV